MIRMNSKFIVDKLKRIYIVSRTYDLLNESYYKFFYSDIRLITKMYQKELGFKPNLKSPELFSEKLQWLKLHWFNLEAQQCADKFLVRDYVEKKVGKKYLNRLISYYDNVDDIDLSILPQCFVLKATHASGNGFISICKDKSTYDWKLQKIKLKRALKVNYYWKRREWVYKDIKPRIICEEFLVDEEQSSELIDYKFYCFNGIPTYCQVIQNRKKSVEVDFYDMNWNHMDFNGLQKAPFSPKLTEKPEGLHEMIEVAAILASDFPFVRVDFYYVNKRVIFGEMTFFPKSGYGKFTPDEWNLRIGDMIDLRSIPRRDYE